MAERRAHYEGVKYLIDLKNTSKTIYDFSTDEWPVAKRARQFGHAMQIINHH
jgi:hypothetical protein